MFFDGSTRSVRRIDEPVADDVVERGARRRVSRVRRRSPSSASRVGAEARRERRDDSRARAEHLAGRRHRYDAAHRVGVEPGRAAGERRAQLLGDVGRAARRMPSGPQNGVCVKCTMRRSGRRARKLRGHERELIVLHEHDVAFGGRRLGRGREALRSPRRTRPTHRGTGDRSAGGARGRTSRGRGTTARRSRRRRSAAGARRGSRSRRCRSTSRSSVAPASAAATSSADIAAAIHVCSDRARRAATGRAR